MSEQAETVMVALLWCQAKGMKPPEEIMKRAAGLVREGDFGLYMELSEAYGLHCADQALQES